jgi:hypothetical protein
LVVAYKAIELNAETHQKTGRELTLQAATRQEAVALLLDALSVAESEARVDPTRTMVAIGASLWTLVAPRATEAATPDRRGGAKHKQVR